MPHTHSLIRNNNNFRFSSNANTHHFYDTSNGDRRLARPCFFLRCFLSLCTFHFLYILSLCALRTHRTSSQPFRLFFFANICCLLIAFRATAKCAPRTHKTIFKPVPEKCVASPLSFVRAVKCKKIRTLASRR